MWPTLGSRTAKEQNRTVGVASAINARRGNCTPAGRDDGRKTDLRVGTRRSTGTVCRRRQRGRRRKERRLFHVDDGRARGVEAHRRLHAGRTRVARAARRERHSSERLIDDASDDDRAWLARSPSVDGARARARTGALLTTTSSDLWRAI